MSEDYSVTDSKTVFGMDERVWVALSSVLAAIFLTVIKLIVGVISGSIGILSEALHSALDLVAAGITFFAVRSSHKPADKEYQFGYGKIESLSALVETILLLITVVWIMYESIRRIILWELEIQTDIWSFGVMILAIIIDYSRSRALYKAAEKYDSQALKADALHFSTDILSSGMVIIGLFMTRLGFPLGDPLGAIAVALIVLYMSINLGKETIHSLLDRAPPGLYKNIIQELNTIKYVRKYETVRIRKSGAEYFIDIVCTLDPKVTIEQSHTVTELMRRRISSVVDGPINVIVHSKPDDTLSELIDTILEMKKRFLDIQEIQDIHIFEFNGTINLSMHAEIDNKMVYQKAHDIVTEFESQIEERYQGGIEIFTHIEPARYQRIRDYDPMVIKPKICEIIAKIDLLEHPHNIIVQQISKEKFSISLHCETKGDLSVDVVHQASMIFEDEIREEMPFFSDITIHVEPI